MTARRRSRKRHVGSVAGAIALGLAALAAGFPPVLRAATTERIVVDRHTGLALYGVDPVAYFTDGRMIVGRAEFEYRHAGAIWHFHNEGNLAAFRADPDVYMPRFGGYDPVGIARGVSTPGFGQLWAVFEQRLYLFYTAEARRSFMANPAAVIAAATARWAEVRSELSE
jgi:YHS domain-containing protein